MFRRFLIGSAALLASSSMIAYAGPKEDVQAAVQKLGDAPNYSWTTTVEGGFGAGATEGKTEKGGYTVTSIAMRQTSYDIVLKDKAAAIKTPDGWKSLAELAVPDPNGGFNPATFIAARVQTFKSPTDTAKDAIDKLQEVKKADDAYTADLSPDYIKAQMQFGGRGGRRGGAAGGAPPAPPEIKNPKGDLKFWIKDGMISKVAMHITGTMSFGGNDMDIDRTTTTDIKDIGSTKIEVPDEAKAKLAAPAPAPAP
jgi:hypothetical protein